MGIEEESCITWSKLILSSQISEWLHGQLEVLSPLQQSPLASVKGPELGKSCSPFSFVDLVKLSADNKGDKIQLNHTLGNPLC